MSEAVKSVPLFYGNYGENENPSAWFAQFELSLPISWTDTQRIQRFGMQLTPGEVAEEWYHNLTSLHLSSFANLKHEFFKRWPPPKRPKLTRAQQKERIMAQVLKEDEIGIWTQEGRTGNYAHVTWALNVSRLALGMGDVDGAMIEYALESIPDLLKDHLKCVYNSWDEFVEDIQDVPNVKLKRGRENLDKERARDAEISKLKMQSAFVHHASTMNFPAPARMSNNLNPSLFTTAPAMPPSTNMPTRGGYSAYGGRGTFAPRILERAALVPQRPNTESGMRQYEADISLWHRSYGMDGAPSLERPYPLRPGTAILGSGECYSCGMVTEPTHLSSQCTATSQLRPQETRWRQYIAGLLRRAAQQQTSRTPFPTPVQYEETSWGDLYEGTGTLDQGYEWSSENYGGPLQTMDQQ
ncbi:hypothetical protein P692DRAFT_20886750 [Suillus brevipes Sb2]|nr:hypothetical protein P692DRAFT_20886750 [Suillus brevipes Sb2]